MTVTFGTRPAFARWTAHFARSTLNRSSASSGFSASNLVRTVSQSSVGSCVANMSSSGGGSVCSVPIDRGEAAASGVAAIRRLFDEQLCTVGFDLALQDRGLRAFESFETQLGSLQGLRADLLELVGKGERALGGEQLVIVHANGGDDLLARAFETLLGRGNVAERDRSTEPELARGDKLLADETALHASVTFVADFVAFVAEFGIRPQPDLQPFAARGADKPVGLAHGGMVGQGHRLGLGKRQDLLARLRRRQAAAASAPEGYARSEPAGSA